MRLYGMVRTGWMLLVLAYVAFGGCRHASPDQTTAERPRPVHAPARQLDGGDEQAWLTAAGEMGDSGFCAARLQLPLRLDQPAWELTYTNAEISPFPPTEMLHYSGLILCSARTPVLFGIDADSGKLAFKTDPYLHEAQSRREFFRSLQFSADGQLFGTDNHGRYYVWELQPDGLQQLAVSAEEQGSVAGFITNAGDLIRARGSIMAAFPATDLGTPRWESQLVQQLEGIVASRSGLVVGWTRFGAVQCCDATGRQLWQSNEAQMVVDIVLDRDGERCYLLTDSGRLICRALATGELLWSYDWSEEVPQAVRRKLQDRLGKDRFAQLMIQQAGTDVFALDPALLCATPEGPVLGVKNGQAIAFDRQGHVRWRSGRGPLLDGGLAFENALLLHVVWNPVITAQIADRPWLLDIPDWPEIKDRAALARLNDPQGSFTPRPEAQNLQAVYTRLVVLDLHSGQVLQELPEPAPTTASLLPARGKIVMAQENRIYAGQRRDSGPCKIVAYNWLAQGS
jgi:hypothetical protein